MERKLSLADRERIRKDWYEPEGVNEAGTISALLDDLDAADAEVADLKRRLVIIGSNAYVRGMTVKADMQVIAELREENERFNERMAKIAAINAYFAPLVVAAETQRELAQIEVQRKAALKAIGEEE